MDQLFKRLVRGGQISASDHNRMLAEVERLSGAAGLGDQAFVDNAGGHFPVGPNVKTIRVTNLSAEDIPAFGVMQIFSAETINGRQVGLNVVKPTGGGASWKFLLNGPQAISAESSGRVPVPATYQYAYYDAEDGTPQFGEEWGPQAGSFALGKPGSGFVVVGNIIDGDLVIVSRVQTVGSTEGEGGGGGGSCDPWECGSPGITLTPECSICACGVDPWVFEVSGIDCTGSFLSGWWALRFDPDQSDANACIWETAEYPITDEDSGEVRTFYWQLQVLADLSASLALFERTSVSLDIMALWSIDVFCCRCCNEMQAECPAYVPVPCTFLPASICICPAESGYQTGDAPVCADSIPCDVWSPIGWMVTIAGTTATGNLSGACGENPGSGPCVELSAEPHLAEWFTADSQCTFVWDSECYGVPGANHARIALYVQNDGNGFVQVKITITGNVLPSGNTRRPYAIYTIPIGSFDCSGPNTLTFSEVVDDAGFEGCDNWPATILIEPAGVLVDSEGNALGDQNGDPIDPTDRTECPECDGSCTYVSYKFGTTWIWRLMGRDNCDPDVCNCNTGGLPGDADDYKGQTVVVDCVPA